MNDLRDIATQTIYWAEKAGVSASDAVARDGSEVSVTVRNGQVETLTDSLARGIGIRVFLDKRAASTYTTDLSSAGLTHMIQSAIALARIAPEDPDARLPAREEVGGCAGDLGLYFDEVRSFSRTDAITQAQRAERAVLSTDRRLTSDGAAFSSMVGSRVFATSDGFLGEYRLSLCSLSAAAIVEDGKSRERDSWYSSARSLKNLSSPEEVGHRAAIRTLQRLRAQSAPGGCVPVLFDPLTASSILGVIFEAIRGDNVCRGDSFLAGRFGERVAADTVNILSDPTMVGGFGSVPFDDEGIRSRKTLVVHRGILTSYVLNLSSARKLGMRTTGNAVRSLAGAVGIAPANFFLEPGSLTANDLIAQVKDGLYVTETLGFGVNLLTGDFSRGARGHWIRNGALQFPVAKVTIAANLRDMLMNVTQVANDLDFRSEIAAPTFRVDGISVAGG